MHVGKKAVHGVVVAEGVPFTQSQIGAGKEVAAVGFAHVAEAAHVFDLQLDPCGTFLKRGGAVGAVGYFFVVEDLAGGGGRAGVQRDAGIVVPGGALTPVDHLGAVFRERGIHQRGKGVARIFVEFGPGVRGNVAVIIDVHGNGVARLLQIVDALAAPAPFPGLLQGGHEHGGEDGNNGDNDKKLDQRERRASEERLRRVKM